MPDLSAFARRLVPARPDLAARRLEGRVAALRFADGERRAVTAPLLDLTMTPEPDAERATQLLHGEDFVVYDEVDGFAWGQALADGYVGHVPAAGLGPPLRQARTVTALWAHVYSARSIKVRPVAALPFLARIEAAGETDGFAPVPGGFVCLQHLAPAAGDWVAQAERLVGVPYLWGGRSPAGLDCSALVQLALMAAGLAAPRDSDMQAALLGEAVPDDAPIARGDLIFWKGHVGIAADADMLLHANAHHMAAVREPLAAALARIAASDAGPVTVRRRVREGWRPPV